MKVGGSLVGARFFLSGEEGNTLLGFQDEVIGVREVQEMNLIKYLTSGEAIKIDVPIGMSDSPSEVE